MFNKLHTVKKAFDTGGNFNYIALNMATIFSVIERNEKTRNYSIKEKLVLTSFIDMFQYLRLEEVKDVEIVSRVIIGYKKAKSTDVADILTDVTIEIERLIFEIDSSVSGRDLDCLLQKKQEKHIFSSV